MNPNAVVDYKNPDLSIMVDIIKDIFCCSVVPKFYHYKKYNLGELANFHNKLKEAAAGTTATTAYNDSAENGGSADDRPIEEKSSIADVQENGAKLDAQTQEDETEVKTQKVDTKVKGA